MDYKIYFKQYKTNLSLLALKNIERQQLMRDILEVKEPSIKAQVITDMPICHGEDNSSVERFVVRAEEQLEELNARLHIVENEWRDIKWRCEEVDACLDQLGSEEYFVIIQCYIEELDILQIADAYQCRYKERRSTRTLQRMLNSAQNNINNLLKLR